MGSASLCLWILHRGIAKDCNTFSLVAMGRMLQLWRTQSLSKSCPASLKTQASYLLKLLSFVLVLINGRSLRPVCIQPTYHSQDSSLFVQSNFDPQYLCKIVLHGGKVVYLTSKPKSNMQAWVTIPRTPSKEQGTISLKSYAWFCGQKIVTTHRTQHNTGYTTFQWPSSDIHAHQSCNFSCLTLTLVSFFILLFLYFQKNWSPLKLNKKHSSKLEDSQGHVSSWPCYQYYQLNYVKMPQKITNGGNRIGQCEDCKRHSFYIIF